MKPAHRYSTDKLQKFDFIVSNPPFNMDFSSIVEILKADPFNRFFAGVPNVPNKRKKVWQFTKCFTTYYVFTF
ncbi:N-6 DNA methylase [Planococcus sp. MB-3u-03]|uniref:N-6 DNA methylase n=1 Tax=Planococcus sp. MB-3u-03 TaxID=2058136 RepID=UPI0012FF44B8